MAKNAATQRSNAWIGAGLLTWNCNNSPVAAPRAGLLNAHNIQPRCGAPRPHIAPSHRWALWTLLDKSFFYFLTVSPRRLPFGHLSTREFKRTTSYNLMAVFFLCSSCTKFCLFARPEKESLARAKEKIRKKGTG